MWGEKKILSKCQYKKFLKAREVKVLFCFYYFYDLSNPQPTWSLKKAAVSTSLEGGEFETRRSLQLQAY
jgi:hypothetical protein